MHTPEVSLYWGRGGKPEMYQFLSTMFIAYEEPQPWWYNTTWFWMLWWGYRPNGFFDMAEQAQYMHDELGITGFGLTTHDLRPGSWDCSTSSLRPSPHWGGEAGIRKFTETVKSFGGHTYCWFPWLGLAQPGTDMKEHWRIKGEDGRPYESFYIGSFDMYHAVNYNHPEVQEYYLGWLKRYITDYGVDGFFWDCGGSALPPDFSPKETRPFQRFPSECMTSMYSLMEKIFQTGRDCTKDFFMWHECFGTDRSPDSLGRTIWGLGYASTFEEYHLAIPAREMFHHALQHVTPHSPPHTQAYSLLGLCAYGELPILREDACKILRPRAEIFLQEFHANSTQDWPWFMPVLTYANARLPHALLHAGQLLQNNALLDAGVTALNHLNDVCFQYEYLSLVGCNGWYPRGGDCAEFDQQPIDAGAMVEANLVAYDITKQQQYFDFAIRAMDWFYGNNIVKTPLYDARSGGCHDGINVAGINANEGAESTLVYLMAQLQLYRVAPNLFTMTMPELSSTAFI